MATEPLTGRTWKVFLGIGAISTLAYFLVGDQKTQMILYQATGIVSVVAMLVGVSVATAPLPRVRGSSSRSASRRG